MDVKASQASQDVKGISEKEGLGKDTQRQLDVLAAAEVEHKLTFLQAMRKYKKAVMWSVIASMATIMESYDITIVGGFFAYPTFQQKYGVQLPNGSWSIPSEWQVALKLGPNIGLIIGVFANGYFAERYGHKKTMIAAYLVLIGTIFITFFAPNAEILLVGEILCGMCQNTVLDHYSFFNRV